jgi:glycosyltransferase involved in cell wall biosynthesis
MAQATVVHIVTQLELGGAQEITLLFCRHLAERGLDVHLVAGRGGLLDAEAERIPALSVHFDDSLVRAVNPRQDVACLVSLARLLRRLRGASGRPMIVHTHSSKAGILGRWAAYAAGVKVRVHSIHGFGFHDWQPWWKRRSYQLTEQVTAKITHAFCAASEANRRVATRLGLLRGGKPSVVLPEAIEVSDYEPREDEGRKIRDELGLAPATPLVGMIACLKPQKAPLDFVKVAARVRAADPESHFFLAGDGILRPEMEAEIDQLALRDRFHLLGWRRDVRGLLGAADVLVLTSLWEGLPRVVLQAMAAGKPIVATRVDGTPEAVADGESGFLLEPHDVTGFAERVSRLIRDPELARRMGGEGRRRVEEFSATVMLEKLDALYEELLSRPG